MDFVVLQSRTDGTKLAIDLLGSDVQSTYIPPKRKTMSEGTQPQSGPNPSDDLHRSISYLCENMRDVKQDIREVRQDIKELIPFC